MNTYYLKFVRKYLYKYKGIWQVNVEIPMYSLSKALKLCTALNNRKLLVIRIKKIKISNPLIISINYILTKFRREYIH